jgi:hypothetical protein
MDAHDSNSRLNRTERLAAAVLGALLALGLWQAYGVLLFDADDIHVQ